MLPRFTVSKSVPSWLLVLSSMAVVTLAFDFQFLTGDSVQSQFEPSGWKSKRLTEMACHCCSNSFNSHCCLRCVRKVHKRGSTSIDVAVTKPSLPESLWEAIKSSESNKEDNSNDLLNYQNFINAGISAEEVEGYEMPSQDSPFVNLLEKARVCACCLRAMRHKVDNGDSDDESCCKRCNSYTNSMETAYGV